MLTQGGSKPDIPLQTEGLIMVMRHPDTDKSSPGHCFAMLRAVSQTSVAPLVMGMGTIPISPAP